MGKLKRKISGRRLYHIAGIWDYDEKLWNRFSWKAKHPNTITTKKWTKKVRLSLKKELHSNLKDTDVNFSNKRI